MENTESATSTKDLKAELEKLQQQRVKDCSDDLNEVLKKHNCRIEVIAIFNSQGFNPQLEVIAND